jgi:hypothetical protein
MSITALVLLGVSGAGKDTIASHFPNSSNIKFSALTKILVARAFGVEEEKLEDKEWRNTSSLSINGEQIFLSAFDLLSALYHGAPSTRLAQANIEWAMKQAKASTFPIFTDVRRVLEMKAVVEAFTPLVILLSRPGATPTTNDKDIMKVFKWCCKQPIVAVSLYNSFSVEQTTEQIKAIINEQQQL